MGYELYYAIAFLMGSLMAVLFLFTTNIYFKCSYWDPRCAIKAFKKKLGYTPPDPRND